MAFRVDVMPRAIEDISTYADYIWSDSPDQSRLWLMEVWDLILSLSEMPERFAVIEESEEIGLEIRDAGFHSHRIIFEIDRENSVVNVLRVYAMAQTSIQPTDLT